MYSQVTVCRGCGGDKLGTVCDLGSQHILDFVPTAKIKSYKEEAVPLTLVMCKQCMLVQLKHSVEPDRMYKKFWYKSGVNESMREVLRRIVADASAMVNLQTGDWVLDIGCNDGTLLSYYSRRINKMGFDPAENLQKEAMQVAETPSIFCDYFTSDWLPTIRQVVPFGFRIITAIAMFYDLENPREFLRTVKEVLHKEGVLVIQINDLRSMLHNNAFDNIVHEHLCHYSFTVLQKMLSDCGMQVVDVSTNNVNGGSIRIFVEHDDRPDSYTAGHRIQCLLAEEEKAKLDNEMVYKQFDVRIGLIADWIRNYVHSMDNVYLYGASTRGSTLMQYLDIKGGMVKGAAERNPDKYGLHMVNTWIPIVSEQEARRKASLFLVLPWHFKYTILEREDKYSTPLLFPLPTPVVYSKYRSEIDAWPENGPSMRPD